jgi:hypothetical protein
LDALVDGLWDGSVTVREKPASDESHDEHNQADDFHTISNLICFSPDANLESDAAQSGKLYE